MDNYNIETEHLAKEKVSKTITTVDGLSGFTLMDSDGLLIGQKHKADTISSNAPFEDSFANKADMSFGGDETQLVDETRFVANHAND